MTTLYSNRSNARRALGKIGSHALANSSVFLIAADDGQFSVNREAAEEYQVQYEAENAVVELDSSVVTTVMSAPVKAVKKIQHKLVIEKDRDAQNGVSRPSAGGVCRQVWDFCDKTSSELKRPPIAKEVKAQAEKVGWNSNNASLEYYAWRKFNGIKGRITV